MKPKVTRLEQIRNDLDKYIKEELEKSPGHRDWEVFSFEDDLLGIIDSFDEIIHYDPTPDYLYDNTGGEPPISAKERSQMAFEQKLIDKG
tara:strand:+ start:46 stop:315 length:270 start_codon:yes stop_codon:yes gene_type:complete